MNQQHGRAGLIDHTSARERGGRGGEGLLSGCGRGARRAGGPRERALVAALTALVLGGTPSVAPAQGVDAGQAGGGRGAGGAVGMAGGVGGAPDEAAAERVRRLTAEALVRIASMDARLNPRPTADDYATVAAVLELVMRLRPQEVETVRLAIEAHTQAGNATRAQELNGKLLQVDPADTVAQLSRIAWRIGQIQSVEERLAAYQRLTGPGGASLDASVRSRLALDAALLHRERGDLTGFLDGVRQALVLDGTNKDAALLLVAAVENSGAAALPRLEAMLQLMYADPLDASTHRAVGKVMLNAGAGKSARRFFDSAAEIVVRTENRQPSEATVDRLVAKWLDEGPAAVAKELSDAVLPPRARLAERRAQMEAARAPADQLPDPASVRLPATLERTWALAADGAGDSAGLSAALSDMEGSLAVGAMLLAEPAKRPEGLGEADIREQVTERQFDLFSVRVLTGRDLDKAADQLGDEGLKAKLGEMGVKRAEGWLAARRGDAVMAKERLGPMAASDPLAELGLAMLAAWPGGAAMDPATGPKGDGGAALAAAARRLGGTVIGVWATAKARQAGASVGPSEEDRALAAMADGVPRWVHDACRDPRRFMSVQTSLVSERLEALTPARVRIRVRNLAPIPLAVGGEGPINSRFLLSVVGDLGSQEVLNVPADVVSAERRLRLLPREELVVETDAERGTAAWVLMMSSGQAHRLKWKVVQGFRMRGTVTEVGGHSIASETNQMTRPALPAAVEPPADLPARIRGASASELADVVAAARHWMYRGTVKPEEFGAEQANEVSAALRERYESGDAATRLMLLAMLPPSGAVPGLGRFDTGIESLSEADGDVRLVKLLTRTRARETPALVEAEKSEDPLMQTVARSIKARLSTPNAAYAVLDSTVLGVRK